MRHSREACPRENGERESRAVNKADSVTFVPSEIYWIPASAGMTKLTYRNDEVDISKCQQNLDFEGRPGGNVVVMLERQVRAALREHGLAGKRLLVAVSGGPDSLALLHALWRLRDEYGLTLCGAHLNHRLRGAESDADAEFAADAFERLGTPYTVDGADVAAYRRRHRLSLEDAARRVRYAFLTDAAAKHGADAIALGHTADDQAETALMHIIRGSGLDGLRGMQALDGRTIGGRRVALFRPMLDVSRAETEGYCDALGLTPRMDASNSSPEFLRNRIRMELVPLLEKLNPSVRDALMRLARNATQDSDYIREHVDAVWRDVARLGEDGVVRLDAVALGGEHAAIRGRVLRRAIEAAGGEVTQRHILDMMALLGGAPGKRLHLSGGIGFVTGYGEAYVGSAAAVEDALMPLPALRGESFVHVPGEARVGGWHIRISLETDIDGQGLGDFSPLPSPPLLGEGMSVSEMLDADCVGDGLWVRGRLPGDRFQPLGMERSKSLREFMIDARIPRRWRDGLPLVASEWGIVCVPGWRIAHWARVTEATRRRLRLSVSYFG